MTGSKGSGSGTEGEVTGIRADVDTHADINWPLLVDRGAESVNSDPEALGCAIWQLGGTYN